MPNITISTLGPITNNISTAILGNPTSSTCFGVSAVLRMSFTLFWFHLIMIIFISPRLGCSSIVHDGFWTLKIIFICALYIGVFFIPHNVFKIWGYICRAGSIIFLIVQAYFLLNASYALNDRLVALSESRTPAESTVAKILLLISSILIKIGAGIWIGY